MRDAPHPMVTVVAVVLVRYAGDRRTRVAVFLDSPCVRDSLHYFKPTSCPLGFWANAFDELFLPLQWASRAEDNNASERTGARRCYCCCERGGVSLLGLQNSTKTSTSFRPVQVAKNRTETSRSCCRQRCVMQRPGPQLAAPSFDKLACKRRLNCTHSKVSERALSSGSGYPTKQKQRSISIRIQKGYLGSMMLVRSRSSASLRRPFFSVLQLLLLFFA